MKPKQKTVTISGCSVRLYSMDGKTWSGVIDDLDAWQRRKHRDIADGRRVFERAMTFEERTFQYE